MKKSASIAIIFLFILSITIPAQACWFPGKKLIQRCKAKHHAGHQNQILRACN